jgi:hypothetical protein
MDLRELSQGGSLAKVQERELVSREHAFDVEYLDPEGARHKNRVVSRILDGDERLTVARLSARRAGVPWEQLPSQVALRLWAVCTIAIQLREPPDWLSRWAVEDDALLFQLYDLCSQHDAFFFGADRGESGEAQSPPRVELRSSLLTSAPA